MVNATRPTTGTSAPAPRRSARQRLLDAADELFYDEGVHTVGIDRVIEHAGVAKASLYNAFGSKDELVQAYLDGRHARTLARLRAAVQQHSDPVARVYAVFDAQAEILAQPTFRGCAFISASAEAPPGGMIEHAVDAYRAELRELFTSLAADTGAADSRTLGRQLHLVYDGAILSAQMDHDPSIAAEARAAVTALLTTALQSNELSTPPITGRSHQGGPRPKKERR
ncbi:TetR/AcrR family transcriptional regulator [Mycobacterium parmense]|uniref:Putative transcriptional regulator, TetR family protein n=1 Tax=Mycobacterium parmense TaxID=185642 RepID=A0A7I7YRY1_9MYCO|nr:TetR/AcrR family transcriptional regulator [Mycobacterium parmense]MCV7353433.1 TetR/AcrR family transcriptional regulator [Mycobacterium parmense]BBZ44007.1 putative transcriptional regulator, TetR family protein [Mycobacterium parmense]